ncbi:hypothetical protein [Paenibacillus andongensis]|uniref:hypothetical protein n=1 Tax=Paenibacillus andongensis TaxID=2975482 RepID=UPI0021BAD550|nr:hypothetical protein [Paenibacillus andongensis]
MQSQQWKSEHLLLLLHIIKNNGNVENLRNHGLDYSQIANMLSNAINDNLAKYDDIEFSLTEEGARKFEELNKLLNRKAYEAMISPQTEYRMDKVDKYEIYLPKDIKNLI